MIEKKCIICGQPYKTPNYRPDAKFCSLACYHKSLIGRRVRPLSAEPQICPICKKEFYQPRCHSEVKTCSRKCGGIYRSGKEYHRKYPIRIVFCLFCHKEIRVYGNRSQSFCSKKCFYDYRRSKSVRRNLDWREWIRKRRIVIKEFNGKCGICKNKGNEVHHILPVSLHGLDETYNLILLCKSCHLKAHNDIRRFIERGGSVVRIDGDICPL